MKPRWEEIEKENPWLEAQYYDFDQDKEAVQKYNPTCTQQIFQKIIWLRYNKNCLLKLILSY